MSSEHQYMMHFFLIFLSVCLGAPTIKGMVSAVCVFSDCKPKLINLSWPGKAFFRLVDATRGELRGEGGTHR